MQKRARRIYTREYRMEAAKRVTDQGMDVKVAAEKLGVCLKTYSNWIGHARSGKLAGVDAHRVQPVSELQAEVSRLKSVLVTACEERDILKKLPRTLRSSASEVRVHSNQSGRGHQHPPA